jgi:hypothetical protein
MTNLNTASGPVNQAAPWYWNDTVRHIIGQVLGAAVNGAASKFLEVEPANMQFIAPAVQGGAAFIVHWINVKIGS